MVSKSVDVILSAVKSAGEAALRLHADNERLRGLLREARRPHYYCDDPWYSCPKAEGGCCDESAGTECRCGADEWNARIDAALGATASHPAEVPHD